MSITINGQTSPATEFAWDGCHKIYLLDNGDADKNGKYGVHALQERRSRIQGAASLGTTARMGPILPAPLHQQLGARQELCSPMLREARHHRSALKEKNHEIIQDIRGRIRSGYRSRPMGVQPHSRHPIRHVGAYRIQDRLQISRPAGSPFIGVENRSRRKIVPGNRQYTKKSHHDRSKPGTRSRQGLNMRISRA